MSTVVANGSEWLDDYNELFYELVCFASNLLDGDIHQAENIVQQCVMKLLEQNKIEIPRNWLYKAVRNKCIDYNRSASYKKSIYIDDTYTNQTNNHADQAINRAYIEWLFSFLDHEEQAIFLARAVYGLSYKEISQKIGNTSKDAVGKKYKRIKEKIIKEVRERRLMLLCLLNVFVERFIKILRFFSYIFIRKININHSVNVKYSY